MKIDEKSGSLYVSGVSKKPLKIPSAMYPLTGEYMMIAKENTAPFDDSDESSTIRHIFDSTPVQIGRCYTNAENLQKRLAKENIHSETLVGWLFVADSLPVMHCLTAIGNHILDFNIRQELLLRDGYSLLSEDKLRQVFAERIHQLQSRPFSEVCTFGPLDRQTLFIASHCSPQKGIELARKLRRAYPKHPAFLEIDSGGATHMQRLITSYSDK